MGYITYCSYTQSINKIVNKNEKISTFFLILAIFKNNPQK